MLKVDLSSFYFSTDLRVCCHEDQVICGCGDCAARWGCVGVLGGPRIVTLRETVSRSADAGLAGGDTLGWEGGAGDLVGSGSGAGGSGPAKTRGGAGVTGAAEGC